MLGDEKRDVTPTLDSTILGDEKRAVMPATVLVFFFFLFFYILRRMGKNKALAHHTSTYFHTRPVVLLFLFFCN